MQPVPRKRLEYAASLFGRRVSPLPRRGPGRADRRLLMMSKKPTSATNPKGNGSASSSGRCVPSESGPNSTCHFIDSSASFSCWRALAHRAAGANEPWSTYSINDRGFKFDRSWLTWRSKSFEEWTSRYKNSTRAAPAPGNGSTQSSPTDTPARCTRTAWQAM